MKKSTIYKTLMVLGITVITGSTALNAATIYNTVTGTVRPDITVKLDNSTLNLKDENGQAITPIIVNGRTYLPVRAIADSTGLKVDWDSATNTVNLSKENPSEEENEKIGIRGVVTNIEQGKDGVSLLVEGKIEDDTLYDKARVAVSTPTKVCKDGVLIDDPLAFNTIKKGDLIEVTFTGPVAESYPVMGGATIVNIITQ